MKNIIPYKSPPVGHDISCVLSGVSPKILTDRTRLNAIFRNGLARDDLNVLAQAEHSDALGNYSTSMPLSESHFVSHVRPDHRTIVLDLYSCLSSKSGKKAIRHMISEIKPEHVDYSEHSMPIDAETMDNSMDKLNLKGAVPFILSGAEFNGLSLEALIGKDVGNDLSCVLFGVPLELLNDNKELRRILRVGLERDGLKTISPADHAFKPGYTVADVVASIRDPSKALSHVSFHTYGEYNAFALDIQSSLSPQSGREAAKYIISSLRPKGGFYFERPIVYGSEELDARSEALIKLLKSSYVQPERNKVLTRV